MKKKKFTKRFYFSLFKHVCLFVVGYNSSEFKKILNRYNSNLSEKIPHSMVGGTYENPNSEKFNYVVWVRYIDDFYSIVHEATHLSQAIMEDVGIKIQKNNTELLAYLVEYWTRTFWGAVGDYEKRIKQRKK